MGRDFGQGFVLQHPATRDVAGLGLALAPRGQRCQHGQEALVAGARLQSLPGLVGIELVKMRVLQRRHVLGDPGEAPVFFQPRLHPLIDHAKMGDVGQRIFKLALGQRAMAPVGEARRLVDFHLRDFSRQGFIGRRIAKAADHGGDLAVEQRIGQHAALQVEDFDILPRRMHHLDDVGPGDQLVERLQIHARREGIDDALDAGSGHLDQAQLGIIGLVAQEFGIQRQIGSAAKFGQKGCQRLVCFDNPHTDRDNGIRRPVVDLVGRQSAILTQKPGVSQGLPRP